MNKLKVYKFIKKKMTPLLDTECWVGGAPVSGIRASRIRFRPANRVGSKKGCYKLVVSEHLGFSSDSSIGSDRRRGAISTTLISTGTTLPLSNGYRYPLLVLVPMCGFCPEMADFSISHPQKLK